MGTGVPLISAEARALLGTITVDDAAMRAAVADRTFDWDRLASLAIREKATAALPVLLRQLPERSTPPQVRESLGRIVRATTFRMLRLEHLLASSLDTLAREGIDVVLLKGAAMATSVYGSFAERPMYDLDLLVRPEQAVPAWHALRADGWSRKAEDGPSGFYRSHYHLPPLVDAAGTGLALEVHTALTDGAVSLHPHEVWRTARRIEVHGRPAFVPSQPFQLLHLATHLAWTHGLASAGWRTFRDLHALIATGEVDWPVIVAAAEAARAGTACYWTFRLARALAGIAIPGEVLQRLRPPRPEPLLTLLERHFAGTLLGPVACPSVQVAQFLWAVGMAPRRSGHGTTRPWHRAEVWATESGTGRPRPLRERVRGHASRGREWTRYVAALALGRPRLRPSAPHTAGA